MTLSTRQQNLIACTLLPGLMLVIAICLLYGWFLQNPFIFDDDFFFTDNTLQTYGHSFFHFDLRWFANVTFGWTANFFGQDLISFRLGNMALHAATSIALFLFLRSLFDAALPCKNIAAQTISPEGLSHIWLAFLGALLFALHPVSVYAAGYLIERTTVMATFFSLLSWRTYLEGLLRGRRWFFFSAVFYFLAVYSKEHAVMVPAVSLALTLLLFSPSRALFKRIALPFALYLLIAALITLITLKFKWVLGSAYEPYAQDMLKHLSESHALHENIVNPYPLSVATQCLLFFKYLLLWLLPNPAWMSIDMREPFATSLLAWPYVLGVPCFVLYGVISLWLLLQRGKKGLLGFAMIFPWLLFVTELSTVRIQEPFVLYRSYLWMGGLFAALPVLLGKLTARHAVLCLLGASLLIAPLSWNRLTTFSNPLLLWEDAVSLLQGRPYLPGFERVYFSRGIAFQKLGQNQKALEDFNRVIAYKPDFSDAYNNRSEIYFGDGRYTEALLDLNKSIEIKPDVANPYFGRGFIFEVMHNIPAAHANFQTSCEMGKQMACDKLHELSRD